MMKKCIHFPVCFVVLLACRFSEGMFTAACRESLEQKDFVTAFAANMYNLDRPVVVKDFDDTPYVKYQAFLAGGCAQLVPFVNSIKGLPELADAQPREMLAVLTTLLGDIFKLEISRIDVPATFLESETVPLQKPKITKYGLISSPVLQKGPVRDVLERGLLLGSTLSYITHFPECIVIFIKEPKWLNFLHLELDLAEYRPDDGEKVKDKDPRYTYDLVGAVCQDSSNNYFFVLKDQRANGEWITNRGGGRFSFGSKLDAKALELVKDGGIVFFYRKKLALVEQQMRDKQDQLLTILGSGLKQIVVQEEKK